MGATYSKRKMFLVKPGYQLRLALTLFIFIIAYSIILGFIIFYPLYREISAAAGYEEQARISWIVLYLHKRVWLGMFVVAFLAAVHAVLSSHRLVGPIVRFERMVKDLVRGDYSQRIRLRKNDELKDLEALVNGLAEVLEKKRAFDLRFLEETRTRLGAALASIEAEKSVEIGRVRDNIKGILNDIDSYDRS